MLIFSTRQFSIRRMCRGIWRWYHVSSKQRANVSQLINMLKIIITGMNGEIYNVWHYVDEKN